MSAKKLPLLLCLCLLVLSGCEESTQISQPQCASTTPVLPPPPAAPQTDSHSKMFYCEACPVIRLDTRIPAQVQTKTEFEYAVTVTNVTDELVTDIVLSDVLANNFQYIRSNPAPTNLQGRNEWFIPQLAPGESREIVGIAMALKAGEVLDFVDVTFKAPAKLRSFALEPKLVIKKSAPAEISMCAPVLYIFKIENIGSGTAKNVKLYDTLPAGLTTTNGSSTVDMPIGELPAGTSRTVSITLKANRTGVYVNNAVALADGEITAESGDVTTVVKKPSLTITASAPQTEYFNMEIPYTITVTNTGDWPAVNTVIEDIIPQGLTFVKASQGANSNCGRVLWKVDRLAPGQSVTTSVTALAAAIGDVENTFRASAECAEMVSATARTTIKGTPGVLLEVSDITDPVKVGNTVTYRIVATNQGQIPVTNIAIKASLDTAMNYVSSSGATKSQFADGVVTFETLSYLAPKTQAIWEVTVRAASEADVRFKAEMTGEQLTSPVMETESTHFYQ
ncbi:MAG: DUF11 domain-containing protein [Planctomycetaceae bacterium]|nr:DUF11 domain-containing protein [Planctomycetaceae bacterium]